MIVVMLLLEVTLFVLSAVTRLSSEAVQLVDSGHFGTFDFAELETVSYEVEIQSAPVSELQFEENVEQPETVAMLSKHGQRYSCQLPSLAREDEAEEEDKLLAHKLPNVSALLQPLSERPCLIKTVGWWTYEYCHGKFVRQYHKEAGKIVGETKILGYYNGETEWDQSYIDRVKGIMDSVKHNIVDAVAQAYHTVYYVNGTECDVTDRQRTAQVEIHCTLEGVDRLIAVKEDTTCNYTLTIQTPLLCSHPMLAPKPGSGKTQAVSCSPVVSQLEYEDYVLKQELIRQQERLEDDDSSAESQEKGSGSKEELSSSEHQLLRKLVMRSITQLAQIASDSLHDSGYLEDRYELDNVDIDVELELDTEVGLTEKGTQGEGEADTASGKAAQTQEDSQSQSNGEKVSDKMKKMANDVNANGKDDALESLMTSLLTNLAATAEYIESQEQAKLSKPAEEQVVPRDVAENFNTGEEPEEEEEEEGGKEEGEKKSQDHSDLADVPPVIGPEMDRKHPYHKKRKETTSDVGATDYNLGEGTANNQLGENKYVQETDADDGVAKSTAGAENESDEQWELDPDLVKEMEQQMEETLGKELDGKDIKVKIITIPESQLKDRENEEGVKEVGASRGREDGSSDDVTNTVASAVSKLIDKLLSDDYSVQEERQKQLELQNSYDQVWGGRQKERRKSDR